MSKYNKIVNYLLGKIAKNEIKIERKMPTIRELAVLFQCSQGTVVRAYTELQQNHIVYSIPQAGYYLVNRSKAAGGININSINFASASPDENILPYRDIQHCLNQAIDKYRQALFNYSPAQGLPSLIDVMVKYLQDYQIFTNSANLYITAGSQQAINILSMMPFPNNKTDILVEQPTYNGILKLLETCSVPVLGIARSFNGIDLGELEKMFATNNIKFFYTNPRFHNPLGTSLSKSDRQHIIKLADQYDVYIVEDDYLSDLEMQNNSYSMYCADWCSRVIYIKSFSKILLPGLRIATVVLPPTLVKCFAAYNKWMTLGTSVLSQGALEIYIHSGMIKTHRKRIRKIYAKKMELLKQKVNSVDILHIRWHVPESGFFACGEFLNNADVGQLISKLNEKNIIIHSIVENYLGAYYNQRILKLSVSTASFNNIEDGVAILLDEIIKMN